MLDSSHTFANQPHPHQKRPSLLFFSGGSAINGLAKTLTARRCDACYLISGFDSGGSSAQLRRSLGMPAVGDLRSRIVALIDQSVGVQWEAIAKLLAYRFSDTSAAELEHIANGLHAVNEGIAPDHQAWLSRYIRRFIAVVPDDFDYRKASLGNIVLAGAYACLGRRLDHVAYLFSQLLNLPDTIRVISLDNAHLVAYLDNDIPILGQHRFTGKAKTPLKQRIDRVCLSATIEQEAPISVMPTVENLVLIKEADLICYPPGSFFSSVIANLLPHGVSEAISTNRCPKVYVPNLGADPEQWQLGICDQIEALMRHQGLDPNRDTASRVLDTLLLDESLTVPQIEIEKLQAWGIFVIRAKLISRSTPHRYNDDWLATALIDLV